MSFARYFSVSRARTRHRIGRAIREIGVSLDHVGLTLRKHYLLFDKITQHRKVMKLYPFHPKLKSRAFVAPNASVIGRTDLGQNSVVEYGSVVRGDVGLIKIGDNAVLGCHVVVHATKNTLKLGFDTNIGDGVYVGDSSHIHGATLEDGCVIGFGSTVLDGAVIGDHAEVAPNSLVLGGTYVPAKQLWGGRPAKYVRNLTDDEVAGNDRKVARRVEVGQVHNRYFETDQSVRATFSAEL